LPKKSRSLGIEFAIVFEEQNLGVPLVDALTDLRERVPSNDLDLLVVALLIHRQIGGILLRSWKKRQRLFVTVSD